MCTVYIKEDGSFTNICNCEFGSLSDCKTPDIVRR